MDAAALAPQHGDQGSLLWDPVGVQGFPPADSKSSAAASQQAPAEPEGAQPPTRLYYAQVTPSMWSVTSGRTSLDPVLGDRLYRRRHQWTQNESKVRELELRRLHDPELVTRDGIPDFSRECPTPLHLFLTAGSSGKSREIVRTNFLTPCRKAACPRCSTLRRRKWAQRAFTEINLASRTWFVTMTATPGTMRKWFSAAGLEYSPGIGRDLAPSQYDAVVKAAYRDIQLWKKRLARDVRGLRFLVTVEKHTGKRAETAWGKAGLGDYYGLPHFHAFVHEDGNRVRYAELKKQTRKWIGFFVAKLVDKDDEKAAWYACKYLSKDNGSRNVWPSFRYGRPSEARLAAAWDDIPAEIEDLEISDRSAV